MNADNNGINSSQSHWQIEGLDVTYLGINLFLGPRFKIDGKIYGYAAGEPMSAKEVAKVLVEKLGDNVHPNIDASFKFMNETTNTIF